MTTPSRHSHTSVPVETSFKSPWYVLTRFIHKKHGAIVTELDITHLPTYLASPSVSPVNQISPIPGAWELFWADLSGFWDM